MSIKPIIFSGPMVRAILGGDKTMTRRLIKPQPVMDETGMWHWKDCQWMDGGLGFPASGIEDHAPRKAGDVLWVRETWAEEPLGYIYRADTKDPEAITSDCWRPSMFMPKKVARIFLRVTDVRVERLQDMTPEDCIHDGGFAPEAVDAVGIKFLFGGLWDSLRKPADLAKYGWDANPWVWVISFERCEKPEGFA